MKRFLATIFILAQVITIPMAMASNKSTKPVKPHHKVKKVAKVHKETKKSHLVAQTSKKKAHKHSSNARRVKIDFTENDQVASNMDPEASVIRSAHYKHSGKDAGKDIRLQNKTDEFYD